MSINKPLSLSFDQVDSDEFFRLFCVHQAQFLELFKVNTEEEKAKLYNEFVASLMEAFVTITVSQEDGVNRTINFLNALAKEIKDKNIEPVAYEYHPFKGLTKETVH